MSECIKAHVQQSRILKIFLGGTQIPNFTGKGREKWGRGKGREGKSEEGTPPNKKLPLHYCSLLVTF